MATASDIIQGALRKLGIRASETPIDDAEMADGLDDLNDLGEANLLFRAVSNVSDTIPVARNMEGALKLVLAEKVSVDYEGLVISPMLAKQIANAWDDIYRIKNGSIDVKFPNTLPLGSGNQESQYLWDDTFFDETNGTNF